MPTGARRQIKLLLHKEYLQKRRRLGAEIAAILAPLILFLLLSAGPLAMVQSVLCGGVRGYDDPAASNTTLDQLSAILVDGGLTPSGATALLSRTAADIAALNATLEAAGIDPTPVLAEALGVDPADLATLTALLGNGSWLSVASSSSSSSSPILSPLNENPTLYARLISSTSILSAGVDPLCTVLQSPYVQGLVDGAGNSSATNSSALPLPSPASGGLPSQASELLALLEGFNASFPAALNLSTANIQALQRELRSLNGLGLSNDELAAAIEAQLQPSTPEAAALLDTLLSQLNLTALVEQAASVPIVTPAETETLRSQLARLQSDRTQLLAYQDAAAKIAALPGIADARKALENGANYFDVISALACPPDSDNDPFSGITPDDIDSRRRRRSLDPAADPDAQLSDEAPSSAPLETTTSPLPNAVPHPSASLATAHLRDLAQQAMHVDVGPSRARRENHPDPDATGDDPDPIDNNSTDYGSLGHNQQALLSLLSSAQIYYTPDRGQARQVIQVANRTFQQLADFEQLVLCLLNPNASAAQLANTSAIFSRNMFVPFATEEDLVRTAMPDEMFTKVLGGIVFDNVDSDGNFRSKNIVYKIRQHFHKVPKTRHLYKRGEINGYRTWDDSKYYYFGFVLLQDLISRAIVDVETGGPIDPPSAYLRAFPTPGFQKDRFQWGISQSMPLFMVLAWIYTVSIIVKSIVYEKEHRLKEFMRMMGLDNWIHWMSWFITSFISMTLTSLLLTFVLIGGKIVTFTNPLIVFLMLETFTLATIMLSFAISVFFSKARLAAASAGIIYFLTYLPYVFFAINEENMNLGQKVMTSFSSTAAFGIASLYMGRFESMGSGITADTFWQGYGPCDDFSFGSAMVMMLFDSVIYALIAWYVEAVFPGDFGIPRPWNFFLQRTYWCGDDIPPLTAEELEHLTHHHSGSQQTGGSSLREWLAALPGRLGLGSSAAAQATRRRRQRRRRQRPWFRARRNRARESRLADWLPARLQGWLGPDSGATTTDNDDDVELFGGDDREDGDLDGFGDDVDAEGVEMMARSTASPAGPASAAVAPADPLNFEPAPDGSKGIRIFGLTKIYETQGCRVCASSEPVRKAVNNLTLEMAEGQITGFLGHNGAGKTTTMSILTGLFPPTYGTALVNGFDIRTDIAKVRESLGICPQYNVLFGQLTVAEHLRFTAMLKGMADELIDDEIDLYLRDLGLEEKRDVVADSLSGGQKRKLSVSMAFIGGSKTVILDEPTAGMDPSARRGTWDLLLKYKKGRTIMLSTHHMDEADLLSDRIAIIARGRARCCGTSLFLKKRFGNGFYVTLVVSGPHVDESPITTFIQSHVPAARLADRAGSEVSYVLPHEDTALFHALFKQLEVRKDDLGVLAYGVTASSLEEVFLKVAQSAEEEEDEEEAAAAAEEVRAGMGAGPGQLAGGLSSAQQPQSGSTEFHGRALQMTPLEARGLADESDDGIGDVEGSIASSDSGDRARAPQGEAENDMDEGDTEAEGDSAPLLGRDVSAPAAGPAATGRSAGTGLAREDKSYRGEFVKGIPLRLQRFRAAMIKRFQYARKDRRAVFSQILLPAIFVAIGMIVATAFPPRGNPPPLVLTPDVFARPCSGVTLQTTLPYVNLWPNNTISDVLAERLVQGPDYSYVDLMDDEMFTQGDLTGAGGTPSSADKSGSYDVASYLLRTHDDRQVERRAVVSLEEGRSPLVRLSAELEGNRDANVMQGWYDTLTYHSIPVALTLINNAVLRTATQSSTATIEVINHPLNKTQDRQLEERLKSGTDLTVAINVIIALSFVPASFVVYLVNERISKSKHLQFVSGMDPTTYWLATFAWDMLNFLVPAFICMVVFLAFNLPAYTGHNFGAVVCLLLLYGFSVTPLMYPANWWFEVPSTAYVSLICANLFIGLTGTLVTFTLELFPEDDQLTHANNVLRWVLLLFPNYALGRGLMDLARNEYTTEIKNEAAQLVDSSATFTSPFDFYVVGRNLLFMFLEGFIYFGITLAIEHYKNGRLHRKSGTVPAGLPAPEGQDDDVQAERAAIEQAVARRGGGEDGEGGGEEGGEEDGERPVLQVHKLTKLYQSKRATKLAVNRLSFGVAPAQCFGLLGVNGAGKTTTFKMLTGDCALTAGEAWLDGYSITSDVLEVRQRMGYCPQFDALCDLLTGRETLYLYARLRGIPESAIPELVDWTIEHLQLKRWADRVTKSYSGGNKRKLSVGVAMLGTPPVLFLDEPSAGLDPNARRFLWDLITEIVKAGRSVVLTSHSMEECEALCNRLAIMVNGAFKCIGSPQHLKSKYGDGYTMIMKVRGSSEQVAAIQRFVEDSFPGARCAEAHNGYIRYALPDARMVPLSTLFAKLEECKRLHNLEDYSISQTSLDEIFCNFAQQQDDDANLADAAHQENTAMGAFVHVPWYRRLWARVAGGEASAAGQPPSSTTHTAGLDSDDSDSDVELLSGGDLFGGDESTA